jgi:hypothetical protein
MFLPWYLHTQPQNEWKWQRISHKEHVKSMLKNITKALHQVFDVHYRSNDSWLEEILKQNKVLSLNISSHNHSKKNKGNLTNYTSLRHYKHAMHYKHVISLSKAKNGNKCLYPSQSKLKP